MVKYLGIQLDHLLRLNAHIDMQLIKAKKAFNDNKKLFNSKYLNSKSKFICYSLLIRPIITCGAPIWYNMNAAMMEKLRIFERKYLRTYLRSWRTSDSDYLHYTSNEATYNNANLPRIDNFIIKICRNYNASLKASNNPSINKYATPDEDGYCKQKTQAISLSKPSFI